jgi:hypothetical protein
MKADPLGSGGRPERVQVHVGGEWLPATALGNRVGRRGRQVLVSCHGHLIWVAHSRTRRPTPTPA